MDKDQQKSRGGRWKKWLGICILIIIVVTGGLLLMFGKNIKAALDTARLAKKAQNLIQKDAQALLRDFPFDPQDPPAITEDLFLRYCQVRQTLGRMIDPILPTLLELQGTRVQSFKDAAQLAQTLGPALGQIETFIESVEPTFRANRLSIELYRYTAIQTWGNIALAGQRNEPRVEILMESAMQEFTALTGKSPRETSMQEISQIMLEQLGGEFQALNADATWRVIEENWSAWTVETSGHILDMVVIKAWEEARRRSENLQVP